MYKPNFCAECGGRIARAHWQLWTSRKFCDTCAKKFRRANILKRASLIIALLGGGFLIGRAVSHRQSASSLIITRNDATTNRANPMNLQSNVAQVALNTSATNAAEPKIKKMSDGKTVETPLESDELVSICGARTLKGTPCQRRVRGTGHRCWQHIGKPAMLPPEKLVVQGKLPKNSEQ